MYPREHILLPIIPSPIFLPSMRFATLASVTVAALALVVIGASVPESATPSRGPGRTPTFERHDSRDRISNITADGNEKEVDNLTARSSESEGSTSYPNANVLASRDIKVAKHGTMQLQARADRPPGPLFPNNLKSLVEAEERRKAERAAPWQPWKTRRLQQSSEMSSLTDAMNTLHVDAGKRPVQQISDGFKALTITSRKATRHASSAGATGPQPKPSSSGSSKSVNSRHHPYLESAKSRSLAKGTKASEKSDRKRPVQQISEGLKALNIASEQGRRAFLAGGTGSQQNAPSPKPALSFKHP